MIPQHLIDDISSPSRRRYWERAWQELSIGLARQAQRRIARKLVVGQAIEANVNKFAGSFASFQRQLRSERQSLQRQNIQDAIGVATPIGLVELGFTYDEYLENLKEEGGL